MDDEVKTIVATPSQVWQQLQTEGELVELPTGRVVRLRPVSMERLYMEGKIPDLLTAIVASILQKGDYKSDDPLKDVEALIKLKKLLCEASMLNPKLSDTPDYANDEISYYDLATEEGEYIMSWAQRTQAALAGFRPE